MNWQEVLRFIGRLLYTVVRCCFIVFIAIILGALHGATKVRMSSGSPSD